MNATVTPLNIQHLENASFHRFSETENWIELQELDSVKKEMRYEIACEPTMSDCELWN